MLGVAWFAAVAEEYTKGEGKQSAGPMNKEETKHGLREGEKRAICDIEIVLCAFALKGVLPPRIRFLSPQKVLLSQWSRLPSPHLQ
ncbi:hypothetical protein NPIL_326011 [Nephila pilipes]|uniref:Uncharacterized protein n=1 Tax=Nephila pilipes TaxID=299642 RepID=A0A8X6PBH0_NEPPI|nr:hypothetical protein NPIL_302441 [Nephila pilipes]GFT59157.1 hypothetical protein NPIL_326011 [Nephila pilipes]